MALPSIDPLCPADDLPRRSKCANTVPNMAERLLSAAWAGMRTYPEVNDLCRDMITYVSMTEPESYFGDCLVVYLNEVRVKEGFGTPTATGLVGEAEFVVRLVESGWPTLVETADGAAEPSKVVENELAWYSAQHAMAMWASIVGAINNRTLFGVGNMDAVNVRLGPLIPDAPSGGLVSWSATVTVDLEGF